MAETLVAKEAFAFTGRDGIPRIFAPGQPIAGNDPDLKGREHLFEDPGAKLQRAAGTAVASETASAAPGERRARSAVRVKSDDEKVTGE